MVMKHHNTKGLVDPTTGEITLNNFVRKLFENKITKTKKFAKNTIFKISKIAFAGP